MSGRTPPASLFDVVCCINFKRRRDRWQRFLRGLPADWPFRKVVAADGVDGERCLPPPWWRGSRGAWGCTRSHLRVIEECLNTGAKSALVFEDDAVFADGFARDAAEFFRHLPDDWQMAYLGGQLLKVHFRPPERVNDWVYRPFNVNRLHAYAVRGEMLATLYRHLTSLDWYPGHIVDHHVSRLHETGRYNIYVPRRWLVGQAAGPSDVSGMNLPEQFWKPPEDESRCKPAPLVVVLGPDESGADAVAAALRELGLHFGDEFLGESARESKLAALCDDLLDTDGRLPMACESEARTRLGDWLGNLMWQADYLGTIAAARHPRLPSFLGTLNELCGDALRVIEVCKSSTASTIGRINQRPRIVINIDDLDGWSEAAQFVERILESLYVASTPDKIAAATAAMLEASARLGHDRKSEGFCVG